MIGNNFYTSADWIAFRKVVINERLTPEGLTVCEYCGKPIVKAYDTILHHIEPLTDENVNDANISLNPQNIMIVHHKCHNRIHGKLSDNNQNVYLVYGSPLSGKSSYVHDNAEEGDLILDVDSIWECISGCARYVKPKRLTSNVFGIRDEMLRQIKMRVGYWKNAYIVGGYPLCSERERLCKTLGAREIFIDTSKEECLERLLECRDRDVEEWTKYIETWWEKFRKSF